jgi:hypothetical protein
VDRLQHPCPPRFDTTEMKPSTTFSDLHELLPALVASSSNQKATILLPCLSSVYCPTTRYRSSQPTLTSLNGIGRSWGMAVHLQWKLQHFLSGKQGHTLAIENRLSRDKETSSTLSIIHRSHGTTRQLVLTRP